MCITTFVAIALRFQVRAGALDNVRSARLYASEPSFRRNTRPRTPKLLPAEKEATELPQRLASAGEFAAASDAQIAADAAAEAAAKRLQVQTRNDFLAEVRAVS